MPESKSLLLKKNRKSADKGLERLGLPPVTDDEGEQRAALMAWNKWDVLSGQNILAVGAPLMVTVISSENPKVFWTSLVLTVLTFFLLGEMNAVSARGQMAQAVIDYREKKLQEQRQNAARQVERLCSNDSEDVQEPRTSEPRPRRRWFKRC